MMESENSFARHKYYVSSSSGNDTNDGLTPERAFKTLKRVSEEKLSPGDSLLLKAGDVWIQETLLPDGSGKPEDPIVISSYG